jgi:hypothetical protein
VHDFKVNSLIIAPDSTLNLNSVDSFGIVSVTDFSVIEMYIKNGYADGAWNGLGGITSSVAAADPNYATTLALMNGQDYLDNINTTFANYPVHSNYSLIRYTYYGDANMDGMVDENDFAMIDTAIALGGSQPGMSGWAWGDFNYDGLINDTDYALISYVYSLHLPSLGSVVPEPSTFALLGMSAIGLLTFAWKRRKA